MEDENELRILEEWDTRKNLNNHLKSDCFRVLRGAMNLLREPYEMLFHTVATEKKENGSAGPVRSSMTGMAGADVPSVKPKIERKKPWELS
jgi:hypothetical protein